MDMLDLTVEENIGDGSKIMQLTAMDADEVPQSLSLNFWNLVFHWSIQFLLHVNNFYYPILRLSSVCSFPKRTLIVEMCYKNANLDIMER